ncbi:MAG: EAL domain-containing protein [Nitrococcus mobilis]|nr:EAL domain-containing protein [Nitrococcus mobilis]
MNRPSTLRIRLMLLVGLSILPTFLLVCYHTWEERTEAHASAQADAEQLVRSAVAEQTALTAAAHQLLSILSKLPEVRQRLDSCQQTLRRLLDLYPRYSNLGVIALDGSVPCSALPFSEKVNLRDRSYFRRALEAGDFVVGDYQVGRITGKPSVNFGYPVTDNEGQIQSVAYGALDLKWLGHLLGDQGLPDGSSIALYDANDTVLAKYPPEDDQVSADAGNTLSYAEPLRSLGAAGARIEVRVPTGAIFSTIDRRFVRDLGLLGVVALLAGSLAWVGSETLVLRRINALVNAAERLGEGYLDARTGLTPGNDEIAHLARSFDQMAEELERRETALEASTIELRNVNRALRTLSSGNRALLHARDEQWLVEEVCRLVVEVGEYLGALIVFRDPERSPALQVMARAGSLDADKVADIDRLELILETGKAQVFPGPQNRTTLALPLVSSEESVQGVLAIQGRTEVPFEQGEMELLTETANDLTFGIRTLRMQVRERQAQEKIHRMEWYEPLTGLPNRLHVHRWLQEVLDHRADNKHPLALLLLDLNHFRDINTALGYAQADQILQSIAPRISPHLPSSAFVAHMGEDEFAVVLPGADGGGATDTAQRILKALEQPIPIGDLPLNVTASLGIAVYPGHGRDPEALIRAADAAMHRAKVSGHGFAEYTPARDQVTPQRLALAGELRHAIESEQLELHYQPKLDVRTRVVSGAEGLLRWHHPERGQLLPGEFIPLAEETGLIAPLTAWVLQAAAQQYYLWQEANLAMPIAVNLSARNLHETTLVARIETLLSNWGIGAEHLGLELTESALMQNPGQALETLRRLHRMGVKLFIDDFGTGYSSLSYLQKLPIDTIKIDKSFVLRMTAEPDSQRIVESTIALAHEMGKRVVAEGVEDEQALQLLTALKCDAVQGFYISRPLPADRFKQWHDTDGSKWVNNPPQSRALGHGNTG